MECIGAVKGVEGMAVPKLRPGLVLVLVHAVRGSDGVKCLEASDGVEVIVISIFYLGSY